MNWFAEYRMAWIKESVEIFGSVRREHIMKKFGISIAQASLDLNEVRKRWPDLLNYDYSGKMYKFRESGQCETAAVRQRVQLGNAKSGAG